MVRVHGGYYDRNGKLEPEKVQHTIDVVEAMKPSGVYSHLSIYFPLWLEPEPGTPWLEGYDGMKHPFAALYFNPKFQEQYRAWWKAVLLTPGKSSGKPLIDEPALASVEIINEDSYFFWTFGDANIPDAELQIVETAFGKWLTKKYGSLNAALQRWNHVAVSRDDPAHGRVGFRPLWNMFNEKTLRDQDTAAFLCESQHGFYRDTYKLLRDLGFKGAITASNWITASPEVLGPLEKMTYLPGDFIDRHGYFGCNQKGDDSGWSIRDGHTYRDRSALRFEAEEPGKPRQFVHPVMDPHYNDKPSMISETTFCRPNRYRSEAPLYYAAYGALQASDAIVHFAFDGDRWSVKPGFFMQPWTLASPAMLGQFPAAALIYRKGLVSPGATLADVTLNTTDLLELKGTPLPQDAALDELRLADVPQGVTVKPGQRIDPRVNYTGRTHVSIGRKASAVKLDDLSHYIDTQRQTITATTGELKLDYGRGLLTIDAPAAQGASGVLRAAGPLETKDLSISSDMELGHIVAVSLDGRPLARSARILLQVMSEEKASDFQTEPLANGTKRIVNIGHDPWLVRELHGTLKFKRPDAASLTVTALDHSGYPIKSCGNAKEIRLLPTTMYYMIAR